MNLKKMILFILDEGQILAQQPGFSAKILQLRHAGVILSINVQNPAALLTPEIAGNSDAFFIFMLTEGRDREFVRKSLSLTIEQTEALGKLVQGQCICYLPRSEFKVPFLAHVPKIEFCDANDGIYKTGREFLKSLSWLPLDKKERMADKFRGKEPRQKKDGDEFESLCLKILIKAACEVGIFLTDIYSSMNCYPDIGRKAVDELIAKAMVREHKVPRSGRGRQPSVLEVMTAGEALLLKKGIKPEVRRLKGGFLHDLFGRWICRHAEKEGCSWRTEYTLGEKTFDVGVFDDDGKIYAFEIVLSGSVSWNLRQTAKAGSVVGIEQLIIVSDNKEFLLKISKEVEALECSEKIVCEYVGVYAPV